MLRTLLEETHKARTLLPGEVGEKVGMAVYDFEGAVDDFKTLCGI